MRTLNRREFIEESTATGAAFLATSGMAPAAEGAAGGGGAAPAKREQHLKVSVLSYSFHRQLAEGTIDIFGYLETCKHRYGLHAADIWNGFLKATDDAYLKRVREALDERELALADLFVDQAHLWETDEALRQKHYENAQAHLRAAHVLGAHFMRVDAGGRDPEWSSEQFDYLVKRYREYAQYAADHGFKVGAENHWGTEGKWANLQKLYRAVDHPGFGLSCHIGAWQGTQEEKDEADRQAAPWVCHTHLDWRICQGPLEAKLENLRQAGYQGYFSVEHHSEKNEYANVAVQLAQVRAVLERWRHEGRV